MPEQRRARLQAADDMTERPMVPGFGVLDQVSELALLQGLRAIRKVIPDRLDPESVTPN